MQANDDPIAAEKEKIAIKVVRRFKNFVGREKKDKGALSPLVLSRGREGVGKTGTEGLPVRAAEPVRLGRIGVEGFQDFRRSLGIHMNTIALQKFKLIMENILPQVCYSREYFAKIGFNITLVENL